MTAPPAMPAAPPPLADPPTLDTLALYPGCITDIGGLLAGHAACAGRPSGCTVVLCPQGMVCGVAVRGGAPGTRETDLLRPENTVDRVHGLLLTGGSAFGLDAAGGVMRWLDEHGHGLAVGPARVPIVPAAVLFDLWLGDARIRPDASTGWDACEAAAARRPLAQGNAGAGLGATVGKAFGIGRAMKGGIGTASLQVGDLRVAALVAVNAIGDVLDEGGAVLAGARSEDGKRLLPAAAAMLAGAMPNRVISSTAQADASAPGSATTIGVVATNARLDKAQTTQLAGLAHHGLSRAISPITASDGDCLFVLASGEYTVTPQLSQLGALAAEAVARAIRNAVRAATGLHEPPLPAMPTLPAARDGLSAHCGG